MEKTPHELGQLINQKRKEIGYTLEELGSLLGITKNAVYRYEKGLIKNIPLEKRIMLSKILGIPPQYCGIYDMSFLGLDHVVAQLSGNNNILKYAFEANRMTNIFLNEMHNTSTIAPLIIRENYYLIDRAAFNDVQMLRIKNAVEHILKTPSYAPEQYE